MRALAFCVLALLAAHVAADMYLQNPPGSNDRNRERSDNRNNANLLFNSQNNARGGYPWRGDATARAQPDPLTYYTGSTLRIEWTNQHACGPNPNNDCQVIIQYACNDQMPGLRDGYPDSDNLVASDNNNAGYQRRQFANTDGQNDDGTTTIPEDKNNGQRTARLNYYYSAASGSGGVQFAMHEGVDWYDLCKSTSRNLGLYHSDRNINPNDARGTRQNNNGDRHGLECPEEREYYPYWRPYVMDPTSTDKANQPLNQPAAWYDVAVLTSNTDWCDFYQENSQNVRGYGQCLCDATCRSKAKNGLIPWAEDACNTAGGRWVLPMGSGGLGVDKPACVKHEFGRDNHLGSTVATDDSGNPTAPRYQPEMAKFDWTIPDRMAGKLCTIRTRYNISTGDYPSRAFMDSATPGVGWDSSYDCTGTYAPNNLRGKPIPAGENPKKLQCYSVFTDTVKPIYNRPYVPVFTPVLDSTTTPGYARLGLAINTDQTARTFQDRSYVFSVAPPPSNARGTIWNLNVRGRRGNIVQAYPAVEYDFTPSPLFVTEGDLIHLQIHGSDFNEAKNANNGEGWQYSDRHNVVQYASATDNYPVHPSKNTLFPLDSDGSPTLAVRWALLGQSNCGVYTTAGQNNDQNARDNCGKLNSAPNRFPQDPSIGLIKITRTSSEYHFGSTRDNNFSNRSLKGAIFVDQAPGLTAGQIAGIVVGTVGGVALLGAGVLFYGKKHPNSKPGAAYKKVSGCFHRGGSTAPKTTTYAPQMEYTRAT